MLDVDNFEEITQQRLRLRANGYAPIPAVGKRPTVPDWTGGTADEGTIRSWGPVHGTNTGIVCGDLVAVDIDVSNLNLVGEILKAVMRHLPEGKRLLARAGRVPRLLLVFRAAEPTAKRATPKYKLPNGEKAQVELLATGQQFIAYGTHPDTGTQYVWLDASPEDTPASELPMLSAEAVSHILEESIRRIESAGGVVIGEGTDPGPRGMALDIGPPPEWLVEHRKEPAGPNGYLAGLEDREPLERVESFLPRLDPGPRDLWLKVGGVLRDTEIEGPDGPLDEGERFDLYHRWSRGDFCAEGRPDGYTGEDACRKLWATLRSGTQPATFASLVHMAGPDAEPVASTEAAEPRRVIRPTPFEWIAPAAIPPRQWLYGHHLIRRFVSMTVSPGGIGKSTLLLTEAVAMASGKQLLHDAPGRPLRVWYWNGEDTIEELQRRVAAICKRYGISESDLRGRLFIDSGRDLPICVATADRSGTTIATPTVEALDEAIREHQIDVLIVDPFVSTHMVPENDNMMMEVVARQFAEIADRTGCAIELVHHTRKSREEPSADDARGASAMVNRARAVRVLSRMSAGDAKKAGIEDDQRRHFVRIDGAKQNLAPPASARWFQFVGVDLENGGLGPGDNVAVPAVWEFPEIKAEVVGPAELAKVREALGSHEWRESSQANDWIGKPIATALGLDLTSKADEQKVKTLQRQLTQDGWLEAFRKDDKDRQARPFVRIGPNWPGATPATPEVEQG